VPSITTLPPPAEKFTVVEDPVVEIDFANVELELYAGYNVNAVD
jgi:hypothetical protein